MPSVQDIEKLKIDLRNIGREPEILAELGQRLIEVPLPSEPELPSIGSNDGREMAEVAGSAPEPINEEPFATPDFATLLSGLNLEEPSSGEPAALIGTEEEFDLETPKISSPEDLESLPGLTEKSEEEILDTFDAATIEDLDIGESTTDSEFPLETQQISEEIGADAERLETDQASGTGQTIDFGEPISGPPSAEIEESGIPGGESSAPKPGASPDEEFDISDFSFGEELSFGTVIPSPETAEPQAEKPSGRENEPTQEEIAPSFFDEDVFKPTGGLSGEKLGEEPAAIEEQPVGTTVSFKTDESWSGDLSISGFEESDEQAQADAAAQAIPGFVSSPPTAGTKEKAGQEEISLTEKELDKFQDTLLSYPLNLRVAVEEIVSGGVRDVQQVNRLVRLLADGATVHDAARLAGKIAGRRIEIPKGYQKRTAEELEREKASVWYIFKTTILPILQVAVLASLFLGVFGFLGYRFVYRPIHADSLYRKGYSSIIEEKFPESEEYFLTAFKIWRVKEWFYRYAQALAEKQRLILAEQKYEELLRVYPRDKKGILDYAALESKIILNYEKAERILKQRLLEFTPKDREGLLAAGDNFLDWAEENPDMLEKARQSFASLIQTYGSDDAYLSRMLLYFIRVDKLKEVLPLKEYFVKDQRAKVDAVVVAELGGYLYDKGVMEDVQVTLKKAVALDKDLPDSHYHLARYFRTTNFPEEERKALRNSVQSFEKTPVLTKKRTIMYIDSLDRYGESFYAIKEYLTAEEYFLKARSVYEESLKKRKIVRSSTLGKIYSNLADIYYYIRGDMDSALAMYKEAKRNLYDNSELNYKCGYIQYQSKNFADALSSFFRSAAEFEESDYLMFATANTLFQRDDYSSAQGYYSELLRKLVAKKERIPLLEPQDRPEHTALITLIMETTNNLGVTLERISARTGDARKRSLAMAYFTEASELYDALARDQATMIRPTSKNLAYINMDGMLHPKRIFETQIFTDISRNMKMATETK